MSDSDTVSSKQPHITTQQQKKAELKFKVNYWSPHSINHKPSRLYLKSNIPVAKTKGKVSKAAQACNPIYLEAKAEG